MNSQISRRSMLASSGRAVTALAGATAAIAVVPTPAPAATADALLMDLWDMRARLRGIADRTTEEPASETRWNDVNDLEDRIFALLATDIARTPVVVAVDTLLAMIEHCRVFDTPDATPYREHSLLPRLERVLPDLTGRLADDVREIVENPGRFLGLTGALTGEAEPHEWAKREPYKINPVRVAEYGQQIAGCELSRFYTTAAVTHFHLNHMTRQTSQPGHVEIIYDGDDRVPDRVLLIHRIEIDGSQDPDAQADIAEWWEMKQRMHAERMAS